MKNEKKGYAVGEVFRHTDGKVYQCIIMGMGCEECAFWKSKSCEQMCCEGKVRKDGNYVKFIEVTEPVEGLLYRTEDGEMYRLKYGEPSAVECACGTGGKGCGCLNDLVFGNRHLHAWYWVRVEEEAPAPVEPPKRHIEIAVVKVEGDKVTFKIADQTHRNGKFSQQANTDEFKACNGITLASFAFPYWDGGKSTLFCRGYRDDRDNIRHTCTAVEFAKICEAVAEYNDTDGRGHEKPWPSVGDKYFCIAAGGKVDRLTFDGYEFDRKMQGFGNFFRTKEEAKAALERVKQALKK